MRIGEFSKKHNITRDTIRHYIDMGLLVSRKDGCHYKFDDTHSKDICKIIELKKLDFSLLEIQKILNFNRLAGENNKEYNKYYLNILQNKRQEILRCQEKYRQMECIIDNKIKVISTIEKDFTKKLGVPIDSLNILNCPICSKGLNVCNGNIENNMIINGDVKCICGYKALIEDGIYREEKDCRLNEDRIVSKLEFMKCASTEFINFYYDGMSEIIDRIKKHKTHPKYMMELEKCSGTLLMQYLEYLDRETTYILINEDKRRLEKIKNNIESDSTHDRFIFICTDYERIPIRDDSIDIMIDHWMTKDYAIKSGSFLLDKLSNLIKTDGLLVGTYPFLTNINTDIYIEEMGDRGYFDYKILSNKFKKLGFSEKSVSQIGPLIDEKPYNPDIKNKKLYLNIYTGIKARI